MSYRGGGKGMKYMKAFKFSVEVFASVNVNVAINFVALDTLVLS